jgi:ABC-2 type transport system ATP-binding protein
MNMEPVIRLDHVTKRFGAQTALDDISLSVSPGVVFALLGENGAGKTTAIRIMLGMSEPDAGKSTVLGLDSRRQGLEIRRRVGYVPERPTLYDWMTVGEIGWFTAGFYDERFLPRYRDLVAQCKLPERQMLKNLSKGMRAKVSLSLAMAHEPELLILDEPTSGLDTLVRREFLESMVDLAAAGRTVLLSSHQIGEVERVADIVAILKEGRLLLVDRLDDLKDQIRQLTITLSEGATGPPPISGEIIRLRQKPRQWQILVRGFAPDDIESLRRHPAVYDLEAHMPSLEEIFVAYMQSDAKPDSPERPREAVAP